MKTVQTVYGVFDTDLGRLVGIAPQGVPDVTFLAGQDTQTVGYPVTALVNPLTGGSIFFDGTNTYLPETLAASLGRTLAVVGDSFLANGRYVDATQESWYSKNPLGWALGLSNNPFTVISYNAAGSSGVTANFAGTKFETQITAALASGASDVLMMGGYNDIANGATLVDVRTAYAAHIDRILASGKRLHIWTQPSCNAAHTDYTVARTGALWALNRWLIERVAVTQRSRNLIVIDTAGASIDPTSATLDRKANSTLDNLHPNNVGAYWMGKEAARIWSAVLPSNDRRVVSNFANSAYSSAIRNTLANGLMVTGSTLATGYTSASGSGSPTCVNSLASRADGYGNDQVLTITAGASGDRWDFTTANSYSGMSAGDIVQPEFEFTVPASPVNLQGVAFSALQNGTLYQSYMLNGFDTTAANDKALPEGFTFVARMAPIVITSGQTTFTAKLASKFLGASTTAIKVGRCSINRLHAAASN